MIYGYCRVSTKEQNLDRQMDALNAYKPVDKLVTDKQSGKDFARDGYQQMKAEITAGDELVVKELDRLGRNKVEVKAELEWFKQKGVVVRILDVPTTLIDFGGQAWIQDMVNNLLIEVLGSVAEQERQKILTRQAEGIRAKRESGNWSDYGRPKKVVPKEDLQKISEKQKGGFCTVTEAAAELGVSKATYYKLLKEVS